MTVKARASRVATAGSRDVASRADTEILAPTTLNFQATALRRRFSLPQSTARLIAELVFSPSPDTWGSPQ